MSGLHSKYTVGADRLGVISAVICTIHCMVVPALLLSKYAMGSLLFEAGHDGVHHAHALPVWWELLDYVFLAVGFFAVYHAAAHAATRRIRLSLWLSWSLLAIGVFFHNSFHWVVYFASASLITTHVFNIRKHRAGSTKSYYLK